MSIECEKIRKILRDCKLTNAFNQRLSRGILPQNDSCQSFKDDLESLISAVKMNTASVEYWNLNKLMALIFLKTNEEAKAIYHLIEAHGVIHRQQINFRFLKCEIRQKIGHIPKFLGFDPRHMKLDADDLDQTNSLKAKLSELPKEWYMVQITLPYKSSNLDGSFSRILQKQRAHTSPLHLTILPTGTTNEPFCITIQKPPTDMYDICKEIQELLDGNKAELQAEYRNNETYWKMRIKQNNTMKTAVTEMEKSWFKEWRIFLVADPLEPPQEFYDLHKMIDKLIADDRSEKLEISAKTRWILKKIVTSSFCLSKNEISTAVKSVLADHEKLANNIILSIYGKSKIIEVLKTVRRKFLILIVDEHIDYLPFEAMDILKQQPVTRFPCFHVAYAMFKEYESTIENGCKIVTLHKESGAFIVNPAGNLPKMEKRLRLFVDYWLPGWQGTYNTEPNEEQFISALTNHDMLMYCGHGSGIQYLSGERIERLRVQSSVLLFGCNSVKLLPVGGKFPPYGISNQYLSACSPCILGMLWEVTDVDTDKLTAAFISGWIPSGAPMPWSEVDLDKWSSGSLKFKSTKTDKSMAKPTEPEMLRALSEAKEICSQYMTSAAVIVRGLPIKLKY